MISENIIQVFITSHAVTGSIGLITGFVAIIAKKGSIAHIRSGKLFFYSMLLAAATALFVSTQPGHESPFLFVIGLFSSYFVISGNRAVRFKRYMPAALDYIVSVVMIFTGIVMIVYPILLSGKPHIVLFIFGIAGLVFAIQDLLLFRSPEKLKKGWIRMHLGKMMGGYISAVTAFIVVNQLLPGVYGWIAPGVIGGVLIAVWSNKYKVRA